MTGVRAQTPALPTRDQNPLLAGLALPMPALTRVPGKGSIELAAAFNWGTTALVETNSREDLIVDAETREFRLQGAWGLTDRLALQWQLPYRYTGAGTLDSFIDSWHDFFGLPEGDRATLPKDQYRIAYERDNVVLIDSDASVEGLGDISVGLLYALAASERRHTTIAVDVEVPTGDADRYTGNGALDIVVVLAAEQRLGDRWTAYGQAGVSWLGDGDLLQAQQRDVVFSAMTGIGFDIASAVRLNVQLDAHSAAYEGSDIDYLGEAVILTLGGSIRFEHWQLDLGVSEDILVEASPDVAFFSGSGAATDSWGWAGGWRLEAGGWRLEADKSEPRLVGDANRRGARVLTHEQQQDYIAASIASQTVRRTRRRA